MVHPSWVGFPLIDLHHKIDDDSGVGTQVAVVLNNDKVPDIIVGNKKGTFVFLSQSSD